MVLIVKETFSPIGHYDFDLWLEFLCNEMKKKKKTFLFPYKLPVFHFICP